MFNIKGKERIELTPAELATFNTSYSQYLKKGSNYLPYPKLYPYYGGMFYALSNEVEIYRNGNRVTLVTGFYTANSPVLVEMAR
ncbi:Uncharacterised protein [Klebsiella pneumoniae]|nr:Uncharacterised protein [Klebsiella pneumoniae]